MLEAGSRLAHGQRWGFQSKRENENLVACYSRDMVFELQDYQKSQKPTCDLLLSKPRKRPSGVFFQSQNSGESVPCRDKSSKMASRILTEYYWRIQYIRPFGFGNHPRSSSFHFSGLTLPLVPARDDIRRGL